MNRAMFYFLEICASFVLICGRSSRNWKFLPVTLKRRKKKMISHKTGSSLQWSLIVYALLSSLYWQRSSVISRFSLHQISSNFDKDNFDCLHAYLFLLRACVCMYICVCVCIRRMLSFSIKTESESERLTISFDNEQAREVDCRLSHIFFLRSASHLHVNCSLLSEFVILLDRTQCCGTLSMTLRWVEWLEAWRVIAFWAHLYLLLFHDESWNEIVQLLCIVPLTHRFHLDCWLIGRMSGSSISVRVKCVCAGNGIRRSSERRRKRRKTTACLNPLEKIWQYGRMTNREKRREKESDSMASGGETGHNSVDVVKSNRIDSIYLKRASKQGLPWLMS